MNAEAKTKWLTKRDVKILHAEAINRFGGLHGMREESLLESALGRPRNRQAYEEKVSLFELAAAYGFGIAKNHPFIDGNKRAALLAIRAFLFRNGHAFEPDEVETVTMMEGVAGGTVTESQLAEWIKRNATRR